MGGLGSIDETFQNVCKKLDLEFLFSEMLDEGCGTNHFNINVSSGMNWVHGSPSEF